MKTVFSSAAKTIHIFAQRLQHEGRSSNVFFNRNKIYSYGYHFLMGEFLETEDGKEYILINDQSHSGTTNKHVWELRSGTRQYKQFFTSTVDFKRAYGEISDNFNKLKTARKKELYIVPILDRFKSMNDYIDFTGIKGLKKDDFYKRAAKIAKAVSSGNLDDYLKKEVDRIKKDAAKKKAKEAKEISVFVAKFESYEIDRIYFRAANHEDYLRVSQDGETVETSQGLKVPVKDAKLLYRAILAGKEVKGMRVGYYTVTSINGVLTVGCHRINIQSMHKVGKKISKA